mgnify:CR=1 FL=1
MDQKPYTIEQYQRCLQAATRLNYAVFDMKTQPLNSEILDEVYKAQEEYSKVQTEVVNESCELIYVKKKGAVIDGIKRYL